jgi:hypothetical protein
MVRVRVRVLVLVLVMVLVLVLVLVPVPVPVPVLQILQILPLSLLHPLVLVFFLVVFLVLVLVLVLQWNPAAQLMVRPQENEERTPNTSPRMVTLKMQHLVMVRRRGFCSGSDQLHQDGLPHLPSFNLPGWWAQLVNSVRERSQATRH